MKNLIGLLLVLSVANFAYCQTEILEKENLTKRYQNGEFTAETYKQYAQDWRKLLDDFGGYPQLQYDEESGSIKYLFVEETGLSKRIMFDRILEWSAINFGSLDKVLHYKDFESGKIILKGKFDINYRKDYKDFWGTPKESILTIDCFQTYVFTLKDNKFKIEILGVYYQIFSSGYLLGNTYVPSSTTEISIHELYPITNYGSDRWKENLDILDQTGFKISNLVKNLTAYTKSYNNDYGF